MNPPASKSGMFDLAWRMFGVSVRIKPSYWIFVALFAYFMGIRDFWTGIAWILAAFIATMFSKLGQAVVGRLFGYPGSVLLAAMSASVMADTAAAPRWQRIVINLSGLLTSIALFALLYVLAPIVTPRFVLLKNWGDDVHLFYLYLLFFVFFDIVMDILPILPSSGGWVATDLFGYVVGKRDYFCATVLSVLVCAAVIGYSIYKWQHPEAPYFAKLAVKVFPPGSVPFGGGDISPLFIAGLFALSLIYNAANLFFQKR